MLQFDTKLTRLLEQIVDATNAGAQKERSAYRAEAIDHLSQIAKTDFASAIWILEALLVLFTRSVDDEFRINLEALRSLEISR